MYIMASSISRALLLLLFVNIVTCDSDIIEFNVKEDAPVKTLVGSLDKDDFSPLYHITDLPQQFKVDILTGEIRTVQLLNRETKSLYSFIAISISSGKTKTVHINVLDVNDNFPQFNISLISLTISESYPTTSKWDLTWVTDLDEPPNSVNRVEITDGNSDGHFSLETTTSATDSRVYLHLVLQKSLDYETQQNYELIVTATDGGSSPKSNKLTVKILVSNSNDNTPVFTQARYTIKASEETPLNTPLLTVTAEDKDLGVYGEVIYSINHQITDQDHFFDINSKTGSIILKKQLDYEKNTKHEFLVTAQDNDNANPNVVSVSVVVSVTNYNDNPPKISIYWLTGSPNILSSSTPQNSSVALFTGQDPDFGESDFRIRWELNCDMQCNFGLREVSNKSSYLVLLKGLTDYSDVDLNFTITASDYPLTNEGPVLSTSLSTYVRIIQVNEHTPTFLSSVYTANIRMDASINALVLQVKANDLDSGLNGKISYHLASASPWFYVEENTGWIRLGKILNCGRYSVEIQARDHGSPTLTSNTTVEVSVSGSNLYPPKFTKPFLEIDVTEDTQPNQFFSKVQAVDKDCGSLVTYSLLPNSLPIKIHFLSGNLYLTKKLDYESGPRFYQAEIKATDNGGLYTHAALNFKLTDVDDNSPQFLLPSFEVTVPQNAPRFPSVLVRAAAIDDDISPSYQTYWIKEVIGQSDTNWNQFKLNHSSGDISLSGTSELTSGATYELRVSANQNPVISSTKYQASIILHVVQSDEPRFTQQIYTFQYQPDRAAGKVDLGTVSCLNIIPGSEVLYGMKESTGDNQVLHIHPQTGTISVNVQKSLPRQLAATISAQIGNSQKLVKALVLVDLNLSRITNIKPEFPLPSFSLDLPENTPKLTVVFQAYATGDAVKFHLLTDTSYFSMNSETGELTLNSQLNWETGRYHFLSLKAANSEGEAVTTLSIRVTDMNNHPPTCVPASLTISIRDAISVGSKIFTAQCSDRDQGHNSKLTYFPDWEQTQWMDLFSVDRETGVISVIKSVLHLRGTSLSLRMKVEDLGDLPLSTVINLNLKILETNQYPPVWSTRDYTFWVRENTLPHSVIGQLKVIDRDSNSKLSFSVENPNSLVARSVSVIRFSGAITTTVQLDREAWQKGVLMVKVSDGKFSSSVNVSIVVVDVNDETPKFSQDFYQISIANNLPKNSELFEMIAVDRDEGVNGAVSYQLFVPSNVEHLFRIHHQSGIVSLNQPIPNDTVYDLSIVARDNGRPSLSSRATLRVVVRSSLWPTLTPLLDSKLVLFISEDSAVGSLVGEIRAGRQEELRSQRLVYELIERDSTSNCSSFYLDYVTGELFSMTVLDREQQEEYLCQILATDELAVVPPRSVTLAVRIVVDDINDHSPHFQQTPTSADYLDINVQEDLPTGSPIFQFDVEDIDRGVNGSFTLTIEGSDANYFKVDSDNRLLSLSFPLDREIKETMYVAVVAVDDCLPETHRLSSTLPLRIRVEDVNDEIPKLISPTNFYLTLPTPAHTTVTQLVALDRDRGENSKLLYHLISQSNLGFNLDSRTGILYTSEDLNSVVNHFVNSSETKSGVLKLNVNISDEGPANLIAAATINIRYLYRPSQINLRFERSVYSLTIDSNSPSGALIVQVKATRISDSSTQSLSESAAYIRYFISPGMLTDLFKIDEYSGRIVLQREISENDLQGKVGLQLIVAAELKESSQTLLDTCLLSLTIKLSNKHAPQFQRSIYHLELSEDSAFRDFFAVAADDRDDNDESQILYKIISGNIGNKFSLNPSTGFLSCAPLSVRDQNSYQLVVAAVDNGGLQPSLTGSTTISVVVIDENNHAPVFSKSRYAATVREGGSPVGGLHVIEINAVDLDLNDNGRVVYSFREPQLRFSIDPDSGNITTVGPLDRELVSSYSLSVVASDNSATNPRSSLVTVDIEVLDMNDNSPHLQSNIISLNYKSSSDPIFHSSKGFHLTTITATDADQDENARLTYTIAESSSGVFGLFELESRSGRLLTTRPFIFPSKPVVHRLKIKVEDSGSPPLSIMGYVVISVGGEVNLSTIFEPQNQEFSIAENSDRGSPIGRPLLSPTIKSSNLKFSLVGGAYLHLVSCRENSGELFVAGDIDREVVTSMELVMIVEENESLLGFLTILVKVTDVDDNAPHFTQSVYKIKVWEKSSVPTNVLQLMIKDEDSATNSQVDVFIQSGNADASFQIDSSNHLQLLLPLDYKTNSDRELVIKAIAISNPSFFSVCRIKIRVLKRNLESPVILTSNQTINISESTPIGTLLFSVQAIDEPLNRLTFSVKDVTAADSLAKLPFVMGLTSGHLYLMHRLDREAHSRYNLSISVSNGQHVTNTTLTLHVTDANDQAPHFEQALVSLVIAPNLPPGRIIGTVVAEDGDILGNGQLIYSLAHKSDLFDISEKGELSNKKSLSVDLSPSLLTVLARDSPTNAAESTLTGYVAVRIDVRAQTQQNVTFTQKLFNFQVSEASGVGHIIGRAQCLSNSQSGDSELYHLRYLFADTYEQWDKRGVFQMWDSSGDLVLISHLDRESQPLYRYVLYCIDSREAGNTATATLNIEVTDANDNWPYFINAPYSVTLSESQVLSTGSTASQNIPMNLVQFDANDIDYGIHSRLSFSLVSISPTFSHENILDKFSLDANYGLLRLTRPFTRLANYVLLIKVVDCGGGVLCSPALTAYTHVIITIRPDFLTKQVFPAPKLTYSLSESSAVGSPIVRFTHPHSDATITYKIMEEQSSNLFQILQLSDSLTEIITATNFNYEVRKEYSFKLKATNTNGQFAIADVLVYIKDEDEFDPIFEIRNYSKTIQNGVPRLNQVLLSVKASDLDGGSNGLVYYELMEPVDDHFRVNALSGELYVSRSFYIKNATNGPVESASSRVKRESFEEFDYDGPVQEKNYNFVIQASSGKRTSKLSLPLVMTIPRYDTSPITTVQPGPTGLNGTPLVLVICFSVLIAATISVAIIILVRRRYLTSEKKSKQPPAIYSVNNSCDSPLTYGSLFDPPLMRPPLPPRTNQNSVVSALTGSTTPGIFATHSSASHNSKRHLPNNHDRSLGQALSAKELGVYNPRPWSSSGRGSVDDVDEELRMINPSPAHFGPQYGNHTALSIDKRKPTPMSQSSARALADSGIGMHTLPKRHSTAKKPQPDDDSIYDWSAGNGSVLQSVYNHKDYMNKLGISDLESSKRSSIDGPYCGAVFAGHTPFPRAQSELTNAPSPIYSVDRRPVLFNSPTHAQILDKHDRETEVISLQDLSSKETPIARYALPIVNLGDQNKLNHLFDWSPSFQPLAGVFSEIARLKDESHFQTIHSNIKPGTLKQNKFSAFTNPRSQSSAMTNPLHASTAKTIQSNGRVSQHESLGVVSSVHNGKPYNLYPYYPYVFRGNDFGDGDFEVAL